MKISRFAFWGNLALTVGAVSPAWATDGYFEHGIGTQSKGMAGVSLAYPKDSLAIASNPASAIAIGDRFDVDIDYFRPSRDVSITGNAFGPNQSYSGNDSEAFLIPELGYSRRVGKDWAVGLAVYGQGGMNTAYATNPYGRFGATGKAGIDLEQLFLSPTVAYQIAEGQSVGLSVNIVDERFKAQGIGIFGGFSAAPQSVSDKGRDSTLGYGVRLGWQGKVAPWLSLGAAWQSKAYAGGFEKYKGLFADQGGFDVPSSYGAGAVVTPLPGLDVALDVKRIEYSGVGSVGDTFQRLLAGQALGSTDGPGFGWKDTTSVKLGINYQLTPSWQVRAGYGYTTQPIPQNQTFINILAPGTVQHQFTTGTTWTLQSGQDISLYALYALPDTVNGSGSIPAGYPPAGFGGGEANLKLSELAFGVGFGWRF
jgi:long-chain fatty acid transport protein